MEEYKEIVTGDIIKSKKEDDGAVENQNFSMWYIRYPQETLKDTYYKEILNQTDTKKRNQLIDELVDIASKDSFKTGFFPKGQEVMVGGFGNYSFLLDDNEIYYMFFDNLKQTIEEHKNGDIPLEKIREYIVSIAIFKAESQYFGKNKFSRGTRLSLLAKTYDKETDTFPVPSIKVLKGKGLAECVELASVAHNLWTLVGVKSYYICSKNCFFENIDDEYKSDAHSFNIVYYNNSYKVFDKALGNYGKVEGNPIKDLLEDKPVILKGNGIHIKGVYANYKKLEKIGEKNL